MLLKTYSSFIASNSVNMAKLLNVKNGFITITSKFQNDSKHYQIGDTLRRNRISNFANLSISQAQQQTNGDLKMFLKEIKTDLKEARFWIKQFKSQVNSFKPFAVVQIDSYVFENPSSLDKLCSYLSFLQRHDMKIVIVHGIDKQGGLINRNDIKILRKTITHNTMLLISMLESYGSNARPVLAGSHFIQAEKCDSSNFFGQITDVNVDPIEWSLKSGHIPIIQSIGEDADGLLLNLDVWETVYKISTIFTPQKVLRINASGGIYDSDGKIIPKISLPNDFENPMLKLSVMQDLKENILQIYDLLQSLPATSSVVITSPTQVFAELFTHNGAGTMLCCNERVVKYNSVSDVDKTRLTELLNKSFQKTLKRNYFNSIENRIKSIYLSEKYNAAAIITKEEDVDIPYLCKFTISEIKQGEGISDVLWNKIRQDYPKLFWRSRIDNKINSWYFNKCEGSWSSGKWIVFWYGINNHSLSKKLIEHALSLPECFHSDVYSSE